MKLYVISLVLLFSGLHAGNETGVGSQNPHGLQLALRDGSRISVQKDEHLGRLFKVARTDAQGTARSFTLVYSQLNYNRGMGTTLKIEGIAEKYDQGTSVVVLKINNNDEFTVDTAFFDQHNGTVVYVNEWEEVE